MPLTGCENCEYCEGEIKAAPVFFAEKPFHPWCRDQFEEEMYGEDPDPALIDAFYGDLEIVDRSESLEDLLNFF